jgi:hypothetical protein
MGAIAFGLLDPRWERDLQRHPPILGRHSCRSSRCDLASTRAGYTCSPADCEKPLRRPHRRWIIRLTAGSLSRSSRVESLGQQFNGRGVAAAVNVVPVLAEWPKVADSCRSALQVCSRESRRTCWVGQGELASLGEVLSFGSGDIAG